jgi:hypothetical protein
VHKASVHTKKKAPVISWLFVLFFCLASQATSAQVLIALVFGNKLNTGNLEFGLMTGPVLTQISNINSTLKPGLNLGLYFNIKLNDRWVLHPEAIPKMAMGAKGIDFYSTGNIGLDTLMNGASIKRSIKAISVPLLVRYRIAGLLYVEAGPQIDLITDVKDIFKKENDGDKLEYTNKIKDDYTRFEVGVSGGLVYKLKQNTSLAFGLRYYSGLTDISKLDAGTQLSSGWMFNVFIPIGAGKAEKLKEAEATHSNVN